MLQLLEHIIFRAALVGLRIGGLMTFMPFLGSTAIPARIKAVFTIMITILLYPFCSVPVVALTFSGWTRIAIGEIVLGLGAGLCMQFMFEAILVAGQVAGFQLAFSLVNLIDPQTNVDTPVLSVFHQLFVLLLFLQMNVHHWILRGVAKSFVYIPVGSVAITADATKELFRAGGAMFLVGLQIATPLLFATVLIDITVGFLSKASPQLPAILLSIPLKNLVGYAVLAVAMGLWPSIFEKNFSIALGWSEHLLHLAQ